MGDPILSIKNGTLTISDAGTKPTIAGLRRWARMTSRTPWRRRSIASWRYAWRHRPRCYAVAFEDGDFTWSGDYVMVADPPGE